MSRSALQSISPVAVTWICRLTPQILILVFFLVLYNNTTQGTAIIGGLFLLNFALLILLSRVRRRVPLSDSLKFGSICSLALLGTVLALELIFPIVLPGEYARTRDLSKRLKSYSEKDRKIFTVVFGNRSGAGTHLAAYRNNFAAVPTAHWKVPGEDWRYYGYEPNNGFSYINIIRWNGHGYFDRNYSYEKPPGIFRIVFVGDSYVAAFQMPLQRTFHKLLEDLLNDSYAGLRKSGQSFQVIALGNCGTGQKNHLRVLQEQALRYDPDLVVVAVCGNDFCDDSAQLRRERNLATGEVTPALRGLVRHGLYCAAFALNRWEQLQARRLRVSPEILQWSAEPVPRVEKAWNDSLKALGQCGKICRARGVGFAAMYVGAELEVHHMVRPRQTLAMLTRIPGLGHDYRWDMQKTVRRLTRFCSSQNIPFISLLEPLAAAHRRTGQRVFGDHYTMFGHLVAAQALRTSLEPLLNRAMALRVSRTR